MVLVDVGESINKAKMYAKLLEEELFNLMDAHNIDSIRQAGAKNKIQNLHDALAEIEKANKKPKPKMVEKPKTELRPTPTKNFGKKY